MPSIAPRYRGQKASRPESQKPIDPILTIPDLTPADHSEQVHDGLRNEIPAEQGSPEPEPASDTHTESVSSPVQGMQESVKLAAESAKRYMQLGLNGKLVGGVRSVLPGLVISVSVICLWWIIGRNASEPISHEVAEENRPMPEAINPIADDPLRSSPQMAATTVAKPQDVQPSQQEAGVTQDEDLFDNVSIINRPANNGPLPETQPQNTPSEATAEVPAPSPQGSDLNWWPEELPPQQAPRPADGSSVVRQPGDAVSRDTEFEWTNRGATVASGRPQRSGVAEQPAPETQYRYEQTDPSTYRDPVYDVPPVARRQRDASH